VLSAALAAGWILLRGGAVVPQAPPLEARVRTDPPGLPVLFNGRPLEGAVAQFSASGPFGVLTATQGCREAQHPLGPRDAGTTAVLALEPLRAEVPVDPGVASAAVRLGGAPAGAGPVVLDLDLCRESVIEASAEGYRTVTVVVPAGATPLEARTTAAALRL